MNIKLNKQLVQILSVLFITFNLLGISLPLLIEAKINDIALSNTEIFKVLLFNLMFFLASLSQVIFGIWLYFNAEKVNQDKWTWLFIGLVCGQYSLILLLATVLLQGTNIKQDFFKSIRNSLLLLIGAIVIGFVIKGFSAYSARLITNIDLMHKLRTIYLQIPSAVNITALVILNILFTLKINKLLNENNIEKKLVWIISTLISGIFPVIIFYNLIALKKQENTPLEF